MDKVSQGKTCYSGSKSYDVQHVWGQLIGWFKQTVNKPNASLSADRRGTLSLPDITSFLVSEQQGKDKGNSSGKGKGIKLMYPSKKNCGRKEFLAALPGSFSKQWDCCCKWSFKNKTSIYGSPQFDSLLNAFNRMHKV